MGIIFVYSLLTTARAWRMLGLGLLARKLKRPIVEKAFTKQVDQMYASKETYVRYQP